MINQKSLSELWDNLKGDSTLDSKTKIEDLWKLFSDFAIDEGDNAPCTKIRDGFAALKSNQSDKQTVLKALAKLNSLSNPKLKSTLKEIAKWIQTL